MFYLLERLLLNPLINNLCSMTDRHQLSCKSILKRKSLEIPIENSPAPVVKTAEDSQPAQHCSSSNSSIVNLKSCRQGILKKHSASSFDDDSSQKPILKNRCQSFDDETMFNFNELHSILKRKTSEPCDSSEPHGILKKRDHRLSVQHQQQSPDHDQQLASTTIVAASVADDDVKPILKQKKSESDSTDENGYPKPILKKKSVECLSDDKRPILKSLQRRDGSAKRSTSKRLSVAQRVSNLESIMHDSDVNCGKPAKENARSSRDRSRFHTQPVTPDEIKAIKKYVVQRYSIISISNNIII